jgi:tetratricopeptide (TPR) repeat protein
MEANHLSYADIREQSMIQTNADVPEFSLVAKGRQFLDKGNVAAAVECYGKAYDPDAVDETEARNMLIEARAHLSRKHLLEALESFEEALLMGTDVQRRQALDGISALGEIRAGLRSLTTYLKKGLKEILGQQKPSSIGIALVSDDENVVLISEEAIQSLPAHLAKGGRISRLPPHLADHPLPVETDKCIPYVNQDDARYILEVAATLAGAQKIT